MKSFIYSLSLLAIGAQLCSAEEAYYYYNDYNTSNTIITIEPNATFISTTYNYGIRFSDGDCSSFLAPEYLTAYALKVKASFIFSIAARFVLPAESVYVTNIVCNPTIGGVPDARKKARKLQAGVDVFQDISVNSPCADIPGISCDLDGLEALVDATLDTTAGFATNLQDTAGLGSVALEQVTVTEASVVDESTVAPTLSPVVEEATVAPTVSATYADLCLWATGCDTTSPDKMCEPGTTCVQFSHWSQCQEDAYPTSSRKLRGAAERNISAKWKNKASKLQTSGTPPTCYATNNGPYGGQRYGCTADSDCCNPNATCGSDKLCHLSCQNVGASPTKAPTPTVAPIIAPTVAPTLAPIATPTVAPTVAATTVAPTVAATTVATAAPSAGAVLVPAWGQCGGSNHNGATQCVSGYACVVKNQWYSQCTPAPSASNYMCKWATGCSGSGSSCEPGTYCKEHTYWSQCLENDVSQANCVATDRWGPGGSTCCNPSAAQVGGMCRLPCNN